MTSAEATAKPASHGQASERGATTFPSSQASHRISGELEAETGATLFHRCGTLVMGPGDGETTHHGMSDFTARSVA